MMGTRCMGARTRCMGRVEKRVVHWPYPCQDLVSVCGIGVVRVGAVLQGGC